MKKLLFVAALMALGTMTFGADATLGPQSGDKATADVEVRAEIVDDSFTITDIDGKPLVLDFGKLAKDQDANGKVWTAEVEYKITATKAPDNDTVFDVALEEKQVTLKHLNNALTQNNTLTATLSTDKEYVKMVSKTDTVTGFIRGSIKENLAPKATGNYLTTTTFTATVR